MDQGTALLTKVKNAIFGVNRAFGPPGDYGYSTKEGKALNDLYNVHNEVVDELKLLEEMEAALSEPLTAEEDAAVDRSWQRFKAATADADMAAMLRDCRATFAFAADAGDTEAAQFIEQIDAVLAKAGSR
jgi:hypothetical protein